MSASDGPELTTLIDYLDGRATPEAAEEVDAWVAQEPAHGVALDELRAILHATSEQLFADSHEERSAWSTLLGHMNDRPARVRRTDANAETRRAFRAGAIGMITAICLVAGIGVLTHAVQRPTTQTYRTGSGQRSMIRVADGSIITLAPTTTVTVSPTTVTLDGEAYFSVAPRTRHPFVVQTSNAIVRVLGTRFTVRQYTSEPASRVVVDDGRVALQSSHSRATHTVLSAHMLALVSDSGMTVSAGITPQNYTSWTTGTLVFDHVALRDVVAELTRVYDADIRITDTALARREVLIVVSTKDDSLMSVIASLCRVTDAHVTQHLLRDRARYILAPGRTASPFKPDVPTRTLPLRHLSSQLEQQYGR